MLLKQRRALPGRRLGVESDERAIAQLISVRLEKASDDYERMMWIAFADDCADAFTDRRPGFSRREWRRWCGADRYS